MDRTVTTLADGLGHPEGPDVLPDGRIVMVETYTGKIVVFDDAKGVEDYVICNGGPNACLLGADGAVYITQNGGTVGDWRADVMSEPSIQRGWPDGRCEIVVNEVAGIPLQAPNDLTWGSDGRLYFTDPADYLPDDRGVGRIFAVAPNGDGELLEEVPDAYPNGIAAEADGSIIWVESYESAVYRKRRGEPSELVCHLPEGHVPDGLKIDVNGNLWVTTFMGAAIDVISPGGQLREEISCGGVPLNCVFKGTHLYITDFGDVDHVPAGAFMGGRLTRIDVGVEGMPLFRSLLD